MTWRRPARRVARSARETHRASGSGGAGRRRAPARAAGGGEAQADADAALPPSGALPASARRRAALSAGALTAAQLLVAALPQQRAAASVLDVPARGPAGRTGGGGFPAALGAADDGGDGGRGAASRAQAPARPRTRPTRPPTRWGFREYRDLVEWLLIGSVAWKAYGGRLRPQLREAAAAVGLAELPGRELVGTRMRLSLDIGREKFTWMEPSWGRSGRRITVGCVVELMEGGVARPKAVGEFSRLLLEDGTWSLAGDTLRFNIVMASGLDRVDIFLPPGERLCFKCNAWGRTVGSKGTLLVRRRRWLIRQEWRTVGVFSVETADDSDGLAPPAPLRMQQRFTDRATRDAVRPDGG